MSLNLGAGSLKGKWVRIKHERDSDQEQNRDISLEQHHNRKVEASKSK